MWIFLNKKTREIVGKYKTLSELFENSDKPRKSKLLFGCDCTHEWRVLNTRKDEVYCHDCGGNHKVNIRNTKVVLCRECGGEHVEIK
jgi:hypothetical protein